MELYIEGFEKAQLIAALGRVSFLEEPNFGTGVDGHCSLSASFRTRQQFTSNVADSRGIAHRSTRIGGAANGVASSNALLHSL
jgi:hypothetical protein